MVATPHALHLVLARLTDTMVGHLRPSSPLQRCNSPLSLIVESVAVISLRLRHNEPMELNVSSSTRDPVRLILVRKGKLLKNLMKNPGWIEVQCVKSRLSRL